MIDLRDCRDNIPKVAEEWLKSLHDFLFEEREDKIGRKNASYYDKKEKKADDDQKTELKFFKENFREIVLADEMDLECYSNVNVSEFMKTFMIRLYKDFTQHEFNDDNENNKKDKKVNSINNAHHFFRELNIRTCPYCNRHYTFTLDDKTAKVSPEYDHFYDKASYPLLAVSFYNLVPSCHTCNHVKRNNKANINPYFSGFRRKFELQNEDGERMLPDEVLKQKKTGRIGFGKLGDSEEELKRFGEEQCNIGTFGLQGLYEMHDDYINEIVEKVITYNPTIRQTLVDAFQDQAYSPQQVYDFVWGRYLDEAQHGNRPLSKLTSDILEQLGILPDNDFQ